MFKAFSLQINTTVHNTTATYIDTKSGDLIGGSNTYSAATKLLPMVAQQAVDSMNSTAAFVASKSTKRLVVSGL